MKMLAIQNTDSTPDSLLDRVATVLATVFETSEDEISPDAGIHALPNADSARILESIVVLEEHFGVRLPDEQMFRVETVGDLVALIAQSPLREVA